MEDCSDSCLLNVTEEQEIYDGCGQFGFKARLNAGGGRKRSFL
jgi:hypothetical protein